jgi:hypothetical protein
MYSMTENAKVSCDHQLGLAKMAASQEFVTIGRVLVLRGNDPVSKPITGCPMVGVAIKPCLATLAMAKGHSSFVLISGKPICLDTTTGLTDGTPPGMVNYKVLNPGQSFVNVSE